VRILEAAAAAVPWYVTEPGGWNLSSPAAVAENRADLTTPTYVSNEAREVSRRSPTN